MIKGLYFKLNIEKPFDKEIYDFFQESKHKTKIDTLYAAMLAYKEIQIQNKAYKEGSTENDK